jgi:signal transduction histidine kinase
VLVTRAAYTIRIGVLAGVYLAVAKLGLALDAVSGFATLVWPATGIALAVLVRYGYRWWPGIAIGAFIVNVWTGAPIAVALGISLGNTLEAVLGTYALRRTGFHPRLDRLRDVLALVVLGAGASTLVSATIGVSSLAISGVVPLEGFGATWRAWWLGDALGDLVVAPLLLTFGGERIVPSRPLARLEAATLAAATVGIGFIVFFAPSASREPVRHVYLVFPLLVWAAIRFGQQGAALTMFAISLASIWGTASDLGPFGGDHLRTRLESLQTFMAVVACTVLVLGAAILERKRAIEMRQDLLAIVSHDLKSPLSTIMMTAEALRTPKSAARMEAGMERIQRAADHMDRLIRDLLDSAAIDAGTLTLEIAAHDAGALLTEVVTMHRALAAQRSLSLALELPPASVAVLCDRERLLQVFSNLIANAIKFTPEGGEITLRAEPADDEVRFEVSDTGSGIDREAQHHIFDRYWKTTTSRTGTGLGLYIVRGIVEAHRGRIWVDSAPGSGTVFYFVLPAAKRSLPS